MAQANLKAKIREEDGGEAVLFFYGSLSKKIISANEWSKNINEW